MYVLLKALPPVCMVYTARGESQVANIVRGEAECHTRHETPTKSCIYHTNEAAVFYCILHLLSVSFSNKGILSTISFEDNHVH